MNTFAVGYHHSIRLDEDGNGYIWGNNYYGQLGLKLYNNLNIPTVIPSPNSYKWISFVCGYYNSFGMTENGEVFSWGYNSDGRLGLGNRENQNKSQLLKYPNDSEWKDLFCGGYHTIGISVDGNAFVWGFGYYGQLGLG